MPNTPRVVVYMEGGLVQGVMSDQEVKLLVVDLDTEGAEEKDLVKRTNAEPAYMSLWEEQLSQDDTEGVRVEFSDYEQHQKKLEEREATQKMIEETPPRYLSPALQVEQKGG